MRQLAFVSLIALSACASLPDWLTPDTTSPRAVARAECDEWLGRHNLMQRPRRGTRMWHRLVDLCVVKHMGAGGEIDAALVEKRP